MLLIELLRTGPPLQPSHLCRRQRLEEEREAHEAARQRRKDEHALRRLEKEPLNAKMLAWLAGSDSDSATEAPSSAVRKFFTRIGLPSAALFFPI